MTASITAIARNDAASTSRAVATPNWPISRPASAAPPTAENAKPMFISALPSLSSPFGCSTVATAPRVRPRAVIASAPSSRPSASTSPSTNVVSASSASAAKASASARYSSGRLLRSAAWSKRAVSGGATSAGRNLAAKKNAAVGATACVRS